MEQLIDFDGILILLTTGANRQECQQWEWWDRADVVVSVSANGAAILKGKGIS